MESALVVGLGVTGRSVATALRAHGVDVVAVDDHPTDAMRAAAASIGVSLVESPSGPELRALVDAADVVLPAPGVPETHPVFEAIRDADARLLSEFDLARLWDDRPFVAVTGTDGKTTVTTLITDMLVASGVRAVSCGNLDTPFVDAIDDPSVEVFVVEASSFRLATTERFLPAVAVWLNFAPDHLDAHSSIASYERAKARIWADLDETRGLAIVNAEDPVVLANRNPSVETRTFAVHDAEADACVVDGVLRLPDGTALLAVDELPRNFPHDLSNALAAALAALAMGATLEGVRAVLRGFTGLPHRVRSIGRVGDVEWFDDSKATTPHAVASAVSAFESVVLIMGGRNKGLDLAPLASLVPPVRAVVAMGEAADEVAAAFDGVCPVRVVRTDIVDVVAAAASSAVPGDVVLLSPGCTSFDWFDSYAMRGDAFAAAARSLPAFEAVG